MKSICRLFFLIVALSTVSRESGATNLRPGHLERFIAPFIGEAVSTSFYIRNDSTYPANGFPVYVAVTDPLGSVIFRDTVTGGFVAPRDSILLTLPHRWPASIAGIHTIHVDVEYSQDVNPFDNIREYKVPVYDSTGEVQQYDKEPEARQLFNNPGLVAFKIGPTNVSKFFTVGGFRFADDSTAGFVGPLVKDLWVPPHPEPIEFSQQIDFSKIGVPADSELNIIDLIFFLTDQPVGDTKLSVQEGMLKRLSVHHDKMNIFTDGVAGQAPTEVVPVQPAPRATSPVVLTDTIYRNNMPNVDLDSATYNPRTVPGYAGDKNACGPAAAANSMHWLEREHAEIHTDSTLGQKLIELSALMQRATEQGVTTEQLVRGKLAFIDKHKLPIHVKFQSFYVKADSAKLSSPDPRYNHSATNQSDLSHAFPRTTYRQLYNEMKNGEDVELMGGWYDATGKRKGGHWFAVNAIGLVNGTPHILISHDRDQTKAGGLYNREEMTLDTSSDPGGAIVREWCDSAKKTMFIIESIVSESYDPTVQFPTGGVGETDPSCFSVRLARAEVSPGEAPIVFVTLGEASALSIAVHDPLGKTHWETEMLAGAGTQQVSLEAAHLIPGVYFVTAVSREVSRTVKLVVK